jgi:hypothetical protein
MKKVKIKLHIELMGEEIRTIELEVAIEPLVPIQVEIIEF